jgi:hypothetical protein
VDSNCGMLLWDVTVGCYCGMLLLAVTVDVTVGCYCGMLLWDVTVGCYCGMLLWDVSVPDSFKNYENTVQLGRILPKFHRNCKSL